MSRENHPTEATLRLFPYARFAALACMALSSAALPSTPAHADQSDRIVFRFSLAGLPAGELRIDGKIAGSGYAASGSVATTGLFGALSRIRYDATVQGRHDGAGFHPIEFNETATRGSRNVTYRMVFRDGTPVSVSQTPARKPRSTDVDPRAQGGTIDPLTALYAVLRDVDKSEACTLSVYMFDGTKRSHVGLGKPAPTPDGGVTCAGDYRRIGGFSAKEMADKSVFPFTLTYAPAPEPGRLRVVSIVTDTILGKGRLTRQ
ncbi:DUF3108 domain-containing protein [Paenirhodobacter enshiensis]|nr:DUF3108 domain-containing protein [Paenirhodobacter enshiensis]